MSFVPRLPLNTSRAYYTMGFVSGSGGTNHTFLTKYGYVFPASEFENEGKYTYTLSCKLNEKLEKEIDAIVESVLFLELFKDYTVISPVKERSGAGEPIKFVNIKLRRNPKDDKWSFSGDLPEENDEALLRIQPRVYVMSEKNSFGVYFELKAVEK